MHSKIEETKIVENIQLKRSFVSSEPRIGMYETGLFKEAANIETLLRLHIKPLTGIQFGWLENCLSIR